MANFVFSCFVNRPSATLKRRQWWNLWGRDRIEYVNQWERVILTDLNRQQADALITADFISDVWPNLFLRALGGRVHGVQLEENIHSHSSNIPTEYVVVSTEPN